MALPWEEKSSTPAPIVNHSTSQLIHKYLMQVYWAASAGEDTKGYPFYLPPMSLQPSWRYSTGLTSLGAGAVGWVFGRAWHKEGAEERLTELNGKSGGEL